MKFASASSAGGPPAYMTECPALPISCPNFVNPDYCRRPLGMVVWGKAATAPCPTQDVMPRETLCAGATCVGRALLSRDGNGVANLADSEMDQVCDQL